MLASLVPLPYRWLALMALAVALVGFGWVKGAAHVQAECDATVVKQSLSTALVQQRQAEATVQVVTKYVDRVQTVRAAGATIIKEIPVYVTAESDSACAVPRGFVRLHDAAAAGAIPGPTGSADAAPAGIALSTVAETVAGNYQRARENSEQLSALQDWVRAQQSITPNP